MSTEVYFIVHIWPGLGDCSPLTDYVIGIHYLVMDSDYNFIIKIMYPIINYKHSITLICEDTQNYS